MQIYSRLSSTSQTYASVSRTTTREPSSPVVGSYFTTAVHCDRHTETSRRSEQAFSVGLCKPHQPDACRYLDFQI